MQIFGMIFKNFARVIPKLIVSSELLMKEKLSIGDFCLRHWLKTPRSSLSVYANQKTENT